MKRTVLDMQAITQAVTEGRRVALARRTAERLERRSAADQVGLCDAFADTIALLDSVDDVSVLLTADDNVDADNVVSIPSWSIKAVG